MVRCLVLVRALHLASCCGCMPTHVVPRVHSPHLALHGKKELGWFCLVRCIGEIPTKAMPTNLYITTHNLSSFTKPCH